ICKDEIDKPLEGSQGIGKTKGHHQPLILCSEGCFPLIARGDLDKVVCMPQVNFSVYLGMTRGVKKI
ncbi:hypothetical protein M404DRAFT_168022, partial [Pisolithus tinctorius Marx 270]